MSDIKSKIIAWFNGPQDFDDGIELLKHVTKKNKVLGKLIKRGEKKDTYDKLVWELNKIAGLKKIPIPKAKVENKIKREPPATTEKKTNENRKKAHPVKKEKQKGEKTRFSLIKGQKLEDLPDVIQKLVRENSALYMQRGKKHAALGRLGEENNLSTIEDRKKLVGEIKDISDRMEVLFVSWKQFEDTGVVPNPEVLWPEPATKTADGKNNTAETIEDLKNRKKNLQSSITKDRNLLMHGSKTKPKEGSGHPIPEGPKRTTLEKRILKKEKEILAIDQQIADRG